MSPGEITHQTLQEKKMKLFGKERDGNRRTIYFFGFKITYRKKTTAQKRYEMGNRLTTQLKKKLSAKHFIRKEMGYKPDFDNPKSFNEKIIWMKLYYQNPLITKCCDKFAVKDYVMDKLGTGYIVPTIASWENADEIDFETLPDKFVLKVNWSTGYNIIVRDKSKLDIDKTRRKLHDWMEPYNNSYYSWLNWGYKHMNPVIYAEKYIEQINGQVYDYKFFCFNGEPKFAYVATDHFEGQISKISLYDLDWNKLPVTYGIHETNDVKPPNNLDKAVEISKELSKPFPFVRVDFYEIDDKIYIGEMTFYPGGGFNKIEPLEWDYKLGEMLQLPEKMIIE